MRSNHQRNAGWRNIISKNGKGVWFSGKFKRPWADKRKVLCKKESFRESLAHRSIALLMKYKVM
jgi:hypothetical protein